MVNWQQAGKTWPKPHPHAVRLLKGLIWDQHYRHSNPRCEGGFPKTFELKDDIVTTKPRDIRQLASECSQIMAGVYYVVTLGT